ncbi:MAG: hydrolase [Clostridiaceae bacterium]|nr:hydrolase [Clostridiaceae bacterium]
MVNELPKKRKNIPDITTALRRDVIHMPSIISECSGIRIYGRRIKSIIFTTDVAQIINHNADAVMAVYPFTPHPAISYAIVGISPVPVFAGVGGGTTGGKRCAQIAIFAEAQGAMGLVVNSPTTLETIRAIAEVVDTPIICTVVSEFMDIGSRIAAGVSILNVSGATRTVDIVKKIRASYPDVPIIATGGPTDQTILETIQAGANAITFTPPTSAELIKKKMDIYRRKASDDFKDGEGLA